MQINYSIYFLYQNDIIQPIITIKYFSRIKIITPAKKTATNETTLQEGKEI